jgi:hypothetical protein
MGAQARGTDAGFRVSELQREIEELKLRVAALEAQRPALTLSQAAEAAVPEKPEIPGGSDGLAELAPVIGRALLGIGVAYVLRALTESGNLPRVAGTAAGLVYAALWLYLAARIAPERKIAAGITALTSVLIFGPLLWESVMRLGVLTPVPAAAILAAYAMMAIVVFGRRTELQAASMVTGCSALLAMALMTGTRDLLPFGFALLGIAAMAEAASCFNRPLGSRGLIAIVSDLAMAIAAYLVCRPGGLPESYARVSPPILMSAEISLLLIYVGSTAVHTLAQKRLFTAFETIQTALAFSIGLGAAFQVEKISGAGTELFGLFALAGCAACYAVSFSFAAGRALRDRNQRTYATFGLLLLIAGCFLLLSDWMLTGALCALGVGFRVLDGRFGRRWPGQHAVALVATAFVVSGSAALAFGVLFTGRLGVAASGPELMVTAAALICYGSLARKKDEISWGERLASFGALGVLLLSVAGTMMRSLGLLFPGQGTTVAVLVPAGLCVPLAWLSRRLGLSELSWPVYGFLSIGAYRLLTGGIHPGQPLALAASLLVYGGVLIAVPKLLKDTRSRAIR